MGFSGSVGRGPGPLWDTRDRTPPNAPRDSWRCESIGSEHRRCLANEPTFVGIEHGMRDARNDRPRTSWLHLWVVIGTIRTTRMPERRSSVSSSRSSRSLGQEPTPAARAALASPAQGLYEPLHWALLGADGPFDLDRILVVARSVGLDAERLRARHEGPRPGRADRAKCRPRQCSRRPGNAGLRHRRWHDPGRPAAGSSSAQPSRTHGSRRKARGIGAAPTKAGSASSGPCRGRRPGAAARRSVATTVAARR